MIELTHHRGPHPEDVALFGEPALGRLKVAVNDFGWLLTRGYGRESALKLVGDRYQLRQRQRTALGRVVCSDQEQQARGAAAVTDVRGQALYIDGYNILSTIESALGGGVVLYCRDGTCRDLAGLGGTYRKVAETPKALSIIISGLRMLEVQEAVFYFDKPVSNSARLRLEVLAAAREGALPCAVELRSDVDRALKNVEGVVASSDSAILDRCSRWFNLSHYLVSTYCNGAWVVALA